MGNGLLYQNDFRISVLLFSLNMECYLSILQDEDMQEILNHSI